MAAIYDAATVTLVACTARDATCPLPGVTANTRMPYLIDISGMSEDQAMWAQEPLLSLGGVLARSPHHHRAWTFQEVILSRRCLFFFGSKLFFQCQTSLRKEDLSTEQVMGRLTRLGTGPF
jgi:hypothetical protein